MKLSRLVIAFLAISSFSASVAAEEIFPGGRLIDTNPATPSSEIVVELAQGRDALVDLAAATTDLEFWRLAQKLAIYVSQVTARYGEEKRPYSKLSPGDQGTLRDGYLMIELIQGYLDKSIADPSLAERTIEEATQRLAAGGQSPTVLGCDRLWIISGTAGDPTRISIGGIAFQSTDQAPHLEIDGDQISPTTDSTGGLVSFELPGTLTSSESGVGVQWVDFVAFERRKRSMFRSEVVPLATRIPLFVLPELVASFEVHAEVDVSTSEERPRRSFSVKVEGIGEEKTDSVCLNARAGSEIVASSIELHTVTDELWAPDPVLPGQWIRAEGSNNSFKKSGTSKRACVTVTAKPTDSRHMAVAEAYMDFTERVGTTATETRDFQFDLAWGVHHELELPENTAKYRIDATFFDGSSETFEGAETHRWVFVTWDDESRTLTFTSQTP